MYYSENLRNITLISDINKPVDRLKMSHIGMELCKEENRPKMPNAYERKEKFEEKQYLRQQFLC